MANERVSIDELLEAQSNPIPRFTVEAVEGKSDVLEKRSM